MVKVLDSSESCGSGRTWDQIKNTARGGLFLSYGSGGVYEAKSMAQQLGRDDIEFMDAATALSDRGRRRLAGRTLSDVVLDHSLIPDPGYWENTPNGKRFRRSDEELGLEYLMTLVRPLSEIQQGD